MFGLDPDTISNIKEAFSQLPEIEKVLLYGSRAKGDHKNGSDIDITLLGKNLSLETIYKLNEELYQLYLPYTFDISIFTQINNDDLVEHILGIGKTFYTRNNSQVPKGWEVKKLGEVCKVIAGQSPEGKYYNASGNGLPFYQGKKEYGEKYIGEPRAWTTKITKEAEANDILMSVRAPVGPINFSTQKICIGRGLAAIRASKLIDKEFLFDFLLKHENEIVGNSGAVFNSINKSQIESIEIQTPPLPEQKRIVAILDKAFASIAKAKANAEQNLKNAKELFESYLQGVFENKGEGWEEKTIGEVCSEIFAGGDAPKDNFSKEKNGKYKIPIYANAVKDRGLYGFTDFSRVTEPSITIAARGSGTGHTEIRYEQFLPIVRLIVLIPNLSLVTLEFLKHSIGNLEILRSGSAIPQLTVPMIKEYRIPFPPIKEQQTIVKKLDTLSAKTKKLETIYQKKIEDLEELKKSVLQKAFNGELTVKEIAL